MPFLSAPPLLVSCPTPTGYPVTSPFGAMDTALRSHPHRGVDFGCPSGTPLLACFDGTIVVQQPDAPGTKVGNCIWLYNFALNCRAGYFHMSKFLFDKAGQKVKTGDLIGYSGATGNVSGPHLHLQLARIDNGELFEPRIQP